MGQRIVLTGNFKEVTTRKVDEFVESHPSKKMRKTLPYLTEEEKVSEGIFPAFNTNCRAEFQKSEHEKALLKELKGDCKNKHPKRIVTFEQLCQESA